MRYFSSADSEVCRRNRSYGAKSPEGPSGGLWRVTCGKPTAAGAVFLWRVVIYGKRERCRTFPLIVCFPLGFIRACRSRTVYPLRRTDSALLPKTHRRTRFPHRRDAGRHIPCRWIWSYSSRSHPAAGRTDSRRRTSKHCDRNHPYSLSLRKTVFSPTARPRRVNPEQNIVAGTLVLKQIHLMIVR